jgi:hypothetical protein
MASTYGHGGPDRVSDGSDFFGINSGDQTTNAPGSGHDVVNALDQSGFITTELNDNPPHDYIEDSYGSVDQSYLPHNGVEAAQTGRKPIVGSNPSTTGAGSGGVVSHDHNGVNPQPRGDDGTYGYRK